ENRQQTDTIDTSWIFDSCDFMERRHHIPDSRDRIRMTTGFDGARPRRDKRYPDTPFVHVALAASFLTGKRTSAVKPGRLGSAIERGSIITGQDDQSVFVQSFVLQFPDQLTYLLVKI